MEAAEKNQLLIFFKKAIGLLSFFVLFFAASNSLAATLYFSPSSGSKPVGKTFSVSVFVSSADQAMNAASGDIEVSSNLEIVSVSKSGSIFSLWAQEPSFSAGGLGFEGIVLNPGYKGSGGKIITFTLRPKEGGDASVRFTSASVLANDGNGTNILTSFGTANFTVTGGSEPSEEPAPVETSGVPAAPTVTSANCPGPEGWCTGNDPKFAWILPAGVTGVSILGDHNPSSNPGTASDGLMSAHTYTNVEDGQWYFHIRLKNKNGWGGVTHYKFQIDTQKPDSFTMSLIEPISAFDPRAKLLMAAKDADSGIGAYEIIIDTGSPQAWVDDGSHVFQTKALSPGSHTIIAKAIDKAGNYLAASLDIVVSAMEPPTITEYPDEVSAGQTMVVKGYSYSTARVIFYIQKEGAEPTVQPVIADNYGNFKFVFSGKLTEGTYAVWAKVENDNGASSNPTEKLSIYVSQRAILKIGSLLVSYLSVLVSLVALIALLLMLILYIWRRFYTLKNKLKKEVSSMEKTVHIAFDELRESTRKQVSTLERVKLKRELTKEEGRILTQLKNQLNAAESFINKEMQKIEKDIQ